MNLSFAAFMAYPACHGYKYPASQLEKEGAIQVGYKYTQFGNVPKFIIPKFLKPPPYICSLGVFSLKWGGLGLRRLSGLRYQFQMLLGCPRSLNFAESAMGLGLFRMRDSSIRDLLVEYPAHHLGRAHGHLC
jgi:hypothetical protein